jgi:hypothetical protein
VKAILPCVIFETLTSWLSDNCIIDRDHKILKYTAQYEAINKTTGIDCKRCTKHFVKW